jgi:hypothetical protein
MAGRSRGGLFGIASQAAIKFVQDIVEGQSFMMCDRAASVEG